MPVKTISKELTIRPTECGSCGIVFGLGSTFMQARLDDHRKFYCPNGCHVSWSGPSQVEEERDAARELAERESRRRKWAEDRAELERAAAETARRSAAAYKGWATRVRNRIANGVCPCCNRSFTNVRRHMTSQHPDYTIPEPADG